MGRFILRYQGQPEGSKGEMERLRALPGVCVIDASPRMVLVDAPDGALDAFVARDTELARQVCAKDSEVDGIKEQVFRELLTYMMSDAKTIPRAIRLMLVSRFLERVADHATNIAEMVIYMVESKMVRHTLA